MKKIITLLALCLTTVFAAKAADQIYAVWDQSTTTMWLYYDDQCSLRDGTTDWSTYRSYATTVILTPSMQNARPTSTASWFEYFIKVTEIRNLDYLNTSEVTNMSRMFRFCNKLSSLDLSNFNTSKVTDMSYMFCACYKLTPLDLSNFNTSKVRTMKGMFDSYSGAESLDITMFNTANVTDMSEMFKDCLSLKSIDLSHFNTSNVTDMSYMFYDCTALTSLNLNNFTTTKVTDMSHMFVGCGELTNLDLRAFSAANLKNTQYMFYACPKLASITFSKLNFTTANVTDMSFMFCGCEELTTLDLSAFNTAKVESMSHMFADCDKLTTLDLSNFSADHVQNTDSMFRYCKELTTIICDNDWAQSATLTSSERMFFACYNLTGLAGTKCNGFDNITASYARPDGKNGKNGYFTRTKDVYTYFDGNSTLTYYYDNRMDLRKGGTVEMYAPAKNRFVNYHDQIEKAVIDKSMKDAPLRSTDEMFCGGGVQGTWYTLKNMTEIKGLENLNTEKVQDMNYMFFGCVKLKSLDLSSFNTSNVKFMSNMFYHCMALTFLDVSNFDISNVTDMTYMFEGCSALAAIYCGKDWSTSNAQSEGMFMACSDLRGGRGTMYDESHQDNAYAHPDEIGNPGYFTLLDMPKEVYTEYDGDTTLTYFYDNKYGVREGTIEYYDPVNSPNASRFNGYRAKIKKVKIDASMLNNTLESAYKMFDNLQQLAEIEDLDNLNTANMKIMTMMFNNCPVLTAIDLSAFNTENVTNMTRMFNGCGSLQSLDLSAFNTEKVESMFGMFSSCESLQSVNLSSFNTENVTNMGSMFYLCRPLQTLDLSSFNTAKVENMSDMFNMCMALTTIYCEGDWSTSAVLTNSENMFTGCTNLVGGNGTPWNENYTDVTYARLDSETNPGYFSEKTATGIESVQPSEVSSQKVLHNGQLFILRDGKTYTVMGQEVR